MTLKLTTLKSLGPLFLSLSIMICSCEKKKSDNSSKPEVIHKIEQSTATNPKDPKNCSDSVQNHIIDGNTAVRYITAFWQDQTCIAFGKRYGAGEYVALDTTNYGLIDPIPGMSIFPCVALPPFNDLYFAFKKDTICPENGAIEISDKDTFLTSHINYSGFKDIHRNYDSIKSNLSNAIVPNYLRFRPDSLIDGALVRNMNREFNTKFKSNQDYSTFGFGFMKDTNVADVLRQTYGNRKVVGFWTFFGFDEGAIPQKIRLVIVPVDQNGKMILEDKSCLEKSWPPIMPSKVITNK
jgi:hypothetical protein